MKKKEIIISFIIIIFIIIVLITIMMKKDKLEIGSNFNIGNEEFIVLNDSDEYVTLITKYGLCINNDGFYSQSKKECKYDINDSDDAKNNYVNSYLNTLTQTYAVQIEGSLLSIDDLNKLNYKDYKFLTNGIYFLIDEYKENNMYYMNNGNIMHNDINGMVRPVITLYKSSID